jgi:hypothetical protein
MPEEGLLFVRHLATAQLIIQWQNLFRIGQLLSTIIYNNNEVRCKCRLFYYAFLHGPVVPFEYWIRKVDLGC